MARRRREYGGSRRRRRSAEAGVTRGDPDGRVLGVVYVLGVLNPRFVELLLVLSAGLPFEDGVHRRGCGFMQELAERVPDHWLLSPTGVGIPDR